MGTQASMKSNAVFPFFFFFFFPFLRRFPPHGSVLHGEYRTRAGSRKLGQGFGVAFGCFLCVFPGHFAAANHIRFG